MTLDPVKFLQLGLVYAKLCARISSQLTIVNSEASKDDIKRIIDELIVFRRVHENAGIGNFKPPAWVEELSWKLSEESRKASDLYP
jgi:hypothetical protein